MGGSPGKLWTESCGGEVLGRDLWDGESLVARCERGDVEVMKRCRKGSCVWRVLDGEVWDGICGKICRVRRVLKYLIYCFKGLQT